MQEEWLTELEMVQDYQFRISFDDKGLADIMTDEPLPVGKGEHPNATRFLAAAVGNCLCASLAFCLRKTRTEPISIKATVRTTLGRNEKGRLRVEGMQVRIFPEVDDQRSWSVAFLSSRTSAPSALRSRRASISRSRSNLRKNDGHNLF